MAFLCMMFLKCLLFIACCLLLAVFTKGRAMAALLCLEALVVVTLLILMQHREVYFRVCFIRVGACEGALGLACLVSIVRHRGDAILTL